ncbi:MAG TPA: TetR/AcrR family transcriptional regulator [Myxococcaceae bacterium]|nr:TetR/AcrR family transcriptional regulator [Myxococcaceae bacterium]
MGRPREFDVDEALDRATDLFWARGYEATSVRDLVDALGVNRASLYATFGDKAQLFEAVLHRYAERVNGALMEVLDPPAAGAEAVRAWFKVLIEKATQTGGPRGCLMLNTLTGCSTVPEPLMERVVAGVRASTDRLQEALARDPDLVGRENVRTLARFFAAEGHGLSVLARAGVRRAELEMAAEVALRVLEPRPRGASSFSPGTA